MRVKFTISIDTSYYMSLLDTYPEAKAQDFDQHYEGTIIGTTKSFWGTTYATVMCDDGKVREVPIAQIQQLNLQSDV